MTVSCTVQRGTRQSASKRALCFDELTAVSLLVERDHTTKHIERRGLA